MKKLLSFLICTALILSIIPTAVFAAGETSGKCGDNLTWSYNTVTATLTISGTGGMYNYHEPYSDNYIPPWYNYRRDVKNVVIGSNVTSIDNYVFSHCTSLISVTIPDSITSIGEYVFYYCTSLTSVNIPDSVTTIDENAFRYCTGLSSITVGTENEKYFSSGNCIITKDTNKLILGCKNSTIPLGVISIGNRAFCGCTGLTSINIPDSVTSIGENAFSDCASLTSVNIPDSVTYISNRAFSGCTGLSSITVGTENEKYFSGGNCIITKDTNKLILGCKNSTIPWGVTSIGNRAFSGCTDLTSVTIPDSVTTIDEYAFSNCTGLTSITIPDSVTTIDENAFCYCTGLGSITVDTENEKYLSGGNCIIEKGTNKLILGCKNSTILWGVTSIGKNAFCGYTGLTSINIPDSVTSIGDDAFSLCTGLTSITIPNSVTSIGDAAFSSCTGLSSITVGTENKKYFSSGNCIITKDTNELILGCKNSVIPYGAISIGNSAFSGCTGLTSIAIPDSVTTIEDSAFYGCICLTSITIPESVTYISNWAFSDCTSLKKIYYLGSKEEWNKNSLYITYFPSYPEVIYNATDCDINGHSLGEWIAEVPETCTKDGVKEHYECSVCHKFFDKDKNEITDLAIPAHHTPVLLKKIPLTCTTDGYDIVKCSSCGFRYTVNYVAATGHKFGGWISEIPASCTEDGVKGHYECFVCHKYFDNDKNEITDTTIPATGHNLGEWILRIPETCTENGVREHYECSVCRKYFDKDKNEITDLVIPAHHDPSLIKTVTPTCTTDGYDVVKCLNCGLRYTVNYVSATGHSFGDWTVTKKLTCTTDGEEIRRCGKCGETEMRTTKAQGHKQGKLVKHQNATCTKDGGDYYKCLTCGETYFVLDVVKNGHLFFDGECIDCGIAESDVPFDIDLDCAVSATDLTYLKRILLLNKTAECDPNGDGKLNILDLIALKKRLAEK